MTFLLWRCFLTFPFHDSEKVDQYRTEASRLSSLTEQVFNFLAGIIVIDIIIVITIIIDIIIIIITDIIIVIVIIIIIDIIVIISPSDQTQPKL